LSKTYLPQQPVDIRRKHFRGTLENTLNISAVERDTGLSKDTLRMWERRYRFPAPLRDQNGERIYTATEVEKLRLIKRLMDRGHRPGRIIARSVDDLAALANDTSVALEQRELEIFLELVKAHDTSELHRHLNQALMRHGLQRFVIDIAAPLNIVIGNAWMRGELAVFEEHLYTEEMSGVLRHAVATMQPPARAPRILLTTFPNEMHLLGLLMVEALLAVEGAHCVFLGTETPVAEIARAATAFGVHIVALTFSSSANEKLLAGGLTQLRAQLAQDTQIWAGGAAVERLRKPVEGVELVPTLERMIELMEQWRTLHASA
jgi:DNA-binding transcriptional MerR regulator/methylmalonyl-CoA mutase cobalamin-binding subunit